jgi:hypothetical protein
MAKAATTARDTGDEQTGDDQDVLEITTNSPRKYT